jgi:hypothetical protein
VLIAVTAVVTLIGGTTLWVYVAAAPARWSGTGSGVWFVALVVLYAAGSWLTPYRRLRLRRR